MKSTPVIIVKVKLCNTLSTYPVVLGLRLVFGFWVRARVKRFKFVYRDNRITDLFHCLHILNTVQGRKSKTINLLYHNCIPRKHGILIFSKCWRRSHMSPVLWDLCWSPYAYWFELSSCVLLQMSQSIDTRWHHQLPWMSPKDHSSKRRCQLLEN